MKKSIVSFLSAALLLSSVSSVAFAEQNVMDPQSLVTPQAVGADSGWQTQNNIRARVYTDDTFYGTGANTISVTVEKSTSGSQFYLVYFSNDTHMVEVARGTLSTKATHKISKSSLNPILPQNSQDNFKVLLKFMEPGPEAPKWLGDWFTKNTFTAVRI
ncbi:hypothetical protein [Paenibacillus chitinolyticus]|uniref:hypothetical protein n=1 Tax=Paenibacillus chitinolyticus TaxID=79263 RepID=UPI00363DA3EB